MFQFIVTNVNVQTFIKTTDMNKWQETAAKELVSPITAATLKSVLIIKRLE